MELDEIKQYSIKDYLESRGIRVEAGGRKWFCSSPFSRDTNWSFAIYPNNTFYCWSTGKSGDIIDLVKYIEGTDFKGALQHLSNGKYEKYTPNYKKFKENDDFWKDFDYTKYLNKDEKEKHATISYGYSRSICSGFHCGVYFTRDFEKRVWIRNPALMFVHVDKDLNVCGAKFRNINGNNHPRFTARGRLGFYILTTDAYNGYEKGKIWLCESETSSNSLWEYFKGIKRPATIMSMGGVSSPPRYLPDAYRDKEACLIIDYDGNEELYQERLKRYEHLNATPIKLILPKGEDINSLYHKGEMYKIEHLLK